MTVYKSFLDFQAFIWCNLKLSLEKQQEQKMPNCNEIPVGIKMLFFKSV
jgi:hypothetical protein